MMYRNRLKGATQ